MKNKIKNFIEGIKFDLLVELNKLNIIDYKKVLNVISDDEIKIQLIENCVYNFQLTGNDNKTIDLYYNDYSNSVYRIDINFNNCFYYLRYSIGSIGNLLILDDQQDIEFNIILNDNIDDDLEEIKEHNKYFNLRFKEGIKIISDWLNEYWINDIDLINKNIEIINNII